jgi:hypothetical protein
MSHLSQGRESLEAMQMSESRFQDPPFAANIPELLPVEMSSRATPDSTSTASSSRARVQGFPTPQTNGLSTINKLNEIMFPSEDPFAYPNQPIMELGFQPDKGMSSSQAIGRSQQESPFLVPGAFDDMEGQLMGQVPPYIIQQSGQQMMGLGGQIYSPNSMLTPQQQHQQQQRREQMARQQERELEQMLNDTGFQGDWGVFGRGTFQNF